MGETVVSAATVSGEVSNPSTVNKNVSIVKSLGGKVALRLIKTGNRVDVTVDKDVGATAPLAPGCINSASWDGVGNYAGIAGAPLSLVSLDVNYRSSVTCTEMYLTTLDDAGKLFKNSGGDAVSAGVLDECSGYCTSSESPGFYHCDGIGCAGNYQAIGFQSMELPEGWTWGAHPSYCFQTSGVPRFLFCDPYSTVGTVTSTIPG